MAERTPLLAGNWKMMLDHNDSHALIQQLAASLTADDLAAVEVAVLPSFTSIRSVQTALEDGGIAIAWGGQDISTEDKGARTGEISGPMLSALGCTYVAVGHSERRQFHAEDDAVVNSKVKASFRHGLVPILCIGELLETRKAGEHVAVTLAQLDGAMADLPADEAARIVVAYEPVWAIGTGETASPEDAQEMCSAIRVRLAELYDQSVADAVRVLYGGSVKSGNVASIMSQPDVDGGLVGGASVDAAEWTAIVQYRNA